MHLSGLRIPLNANSLYVCTLPLTGSAFHWSLIHVDHDGIHTRHHWAAVTRDIQGREAYVENVLPYGALPSTGNNKILGYFKISDYTPIDVAALRDVCRRIFPISYSTVAENRSYSITCRTWISQVLSKLISEGRAQEIEEHVKKLSTVQSNEYANSFLWGRHFMCIVENV
ncbi:hypothetical protein BDY19DRAFT_522981 [Irpex rosettiformis]|uniref:Uncharacterized protein n=1 Tax=Irpex rosettiformis TaxID=378272 RepID=A0ACB8TRL0_9APHY|nr:hypothetical protein BDY19DRAFT_522981 [Irpex rosettiformis]